MGGYEHDHTSLEGIPGLDPTNLRPKPRHTNPSFRRIVAPSFRYDVTYYTNNSNNLIKGLVNRVLTYKGGPILAPSPGAWRSLSVIARRVGGWSRTSPMSPDEFLACYAGRKKTIYAKALLSLAETPLNIRDFRVRAFIKKEKDKLLSSNSDPRIIQPRHPRFLVSLGRYIRPLEQIVYKSLTRLFKRFTVSDTPVCFKGLNYLRRGNFMKEKWESFNNPVAICLDASRFDLHVSEDALQHTHLLYKTAIGNDPQLAYILENRLVTDGVGWSSDGAFRYHKKGGRCSGDNDTSLGNVIIMLSITYAFCEESDIPHIEITNDGDDQVIMVEKEHMHTVLQIEDTFRKFGFLLKVEDPVYELERIDFCQTRPVQLTPDVCTMVRHPRLAMTKDLTTFIPIERGKLKYHMLTAIGKCGSACYDDIPVLRAMYRKMEIIGTRNKGNEDRWWNSTHADPAFRTLSSKAATNVGLTTQCRISFWKAFGILPDQQEALENEWRQWEPSLGRVEFVHRFLGDYPVCEGDV